jgi:hypothetical protein
LNFRLRPSTIRPISRYLDKWTSAMHSHAVADIDDVEKVVELF